MKIFSHLVFSMVILSITTIACGNETPTKENIWITNESGLKYWIEKEGTGHGAISGDTAIIKETTSYSDGTLLFSTDDIGGSLPVVVGAQQVIKGLDEGLKNMKRGEIRHLIVPPSLSIRSSYPDYMSPDSTLYYTVELLKLKRANLH